MEKQRNRPVKYNRELVHKSVKAMQKVEEVSNTLATQLCPAAVQSMLCLTMCPCRFALQGRIDSMRLA